MTKAMNTRSKEEFVKTLNKFFMDRRVDKGDPESVYLGNESQADMYDYIFDNRHLLERAEFKGFKETLKTRIQDERFKYRDIYLEAFGFK